MCSNCIQVTLHNESKQGIDQQVFIRKSVRVKSFFAFSALILAFELFTHKLCLEISELRMCNFTSTKFSIRNLPINSLLTPIVKNTYLNIDMHKFESLQNGESRAPSADPSIAYGKPRAFNRCDFSQVYFKVLFL